MEEFLGSRKKRDGDVPVSWAIFRKEEKPFWYARPCYIYLYSTLVFLLKPSEMAEWASGGQDKSTGSNRTVFALWELACKMQCLEGEPVEKSYVQ